MLSKIRQYFAWQAELKALDGQIERDRPTLADPDRSAPGRVTWRLPVPGKPDAYMAATPGGADHDLFVVPVCAKEFNRLWLAGGPHSQERPDGCRLRAELANDSKFHHAAAGFAEGQHNPVPLARVSLDRVKGDATVRFSDGVTRTYWLLANDVAAFPVIVAGQQQATSLFLLAGAGRQPLRLSELFKQPERTPEQPQERSGTKREGAGQGKGAQTSQRPAKRPGERRQGKGAEFD